MKKYLIAGLGVLGLLSCTMISCNGKKDAPSKDNISYTVPDTISLVQATGRIQPINGTIKLSSEVSGIVERIEVSAGDSVHEGDLLISIDPSVAKLNLQVAKQKLEQEEANLKISTLNIKKSELNLNEAKRNCEIAKRLCEKGAETKQNLIVKQNDLNQKELELKENRQQRDMALRTIGELQENVRIAQENLSKCEIRAPKTGVLLEVSAVAGSTVKAFDELAVMCPDEPIIVEAEVDELFANRLKLGNLVSVHNVGYSQIIAKGKIIRMSNLLTQKSLFSGLNTEQQDTQVRKIKILLDNQEQLPLIGSKVTCDIQVSQKNNN